MRRDFLRHQKCRFQRPAQILLGQFHFLDAQGRAMRFRRVVLVGAAVADVGANHNDGRPPALRLGGANRRIDGTQIVAIRNLLDEPVRKLRNACRGLP